MLATGLGTRATSITAQMCLRLPTAQSSRHSIPLSPTRQASSRQKTPCSPLKLTVQNVEGNHIVFDLHNGIFAFYAHLEKGTLRVKKGDSVKKGDKIAQLGNSGNSSTSHLHFHLVDGPSPLGSNGVPYVISNFDYVGQISLRQIQDTDDYLTGTFGKRVPSPQPRTNQLPLAWAIVDFPEGK